MSRIHETISFSTPEIEIAFSTNDGGLRALRRIGEQNLLGYGEPGPSIDVRLGDGPWLAEFAFVRYLTHQIGEQAGTHTLTIVIGIGPLIVRDQYRVTGSLILRSAQIQNVGEDPLRLRGVRLSWPWMRIGALESCRFEAPSASVRPRIALEVAAEQRLDVLPRRFFAPGLRENRAIEPAPLATPGLMAIHNPEIDESLLCWYSGQQEAALAQLEGNGHAVTLQHEICVAGWLASEATLVAQTQNLLLLYEPWYETLLAFRQAWLRDLVVQAHPVAISMRDAVLYETHPALFGGFAAMAEQITNLSELGINTLCLMPIWVYGTGHEYLWDGNWQATGDLYALRDLTTFDQTLGSAESFLALIEQAHHHGMRVLLDLPLLGCAPDSPLLYEHPTWFCRDMRGQLAIIAGRPEIVAFDWANTELRAYIFAAAVRLLREYQLDGFRAITPREPLANWDGGRPSQASAGQLGHIALLLELRSYMQEAYPGHILIGDMAGPAGAFVHDAVIDELVHHMFVHTALGRITPSELSEWLEDHTTALPADAQRITFTESQRTRLINPLADGMRGSRISRMLFAGMVMCGFIPSIWAGQEHDEYAAMSRVLTIRRNHAVLRCGATSYRAIPCNSTRVFTVLRQCEAEHVIGLLNVSSHHQTITICLPIDTLSLREETYQLHELISGSAWREHNRTIWRRDELLALELTLEPFGAYCFVVEACA